MGYLKSKNEIENYEEKYKFLRENGWEDLWHVDNWIKSEWRNSGGNIDMMGRSMDAAYNTEENVRYRELQESKTKLNQEICPKCGNIHTCHERIEIE